MNVELTDAQIAALDQIAIDALAHGMDIRGRSDLMLADIGHAVHVSFIDSDEGLYALVNRHGHHNGLVIYEYERVCSSYEGEEMCAACTTAQGDPA